MHYSESMVLRVLIVDDAGFIREIMTRALYELGHEIVGEARNGIEAYDKALETGPDVILMDLVLPLKNGVEAAKEVRVLLPNVKIVAVSSMDEKYLKKQAEEASCDAYLMKPFSKAQLATVLNQLTSTWGKEVQNG